MYKQGQHFGIKVLGVFFIYVWFFGLQDLVSFSVKDGENPVLNKLLPA